MSSFKRQAADQAADQSIKDLSVSDHSFSRRTALGLGLAGFGSLLLAACGFHPMYGDPAVVGSAGGADSAKLAQIDIQPIADRIGQELHNRLRDRMNPAGQPDKPAYRLTVNLTEVNNSLASGNSHVRHNTLTVTAAYWLSPADSETSYLMNDVESKMAVSYDTLDDPYNDIVTQQDAERRAIDQLSDMITTRVAAYFAKSTG
jgi:LPS-assembly lipoprotein